MDYNQEHNYLRHALALARLRQGMCAPNPSVGAIVVKDGKIIAEGYHKGPGQPHAEAEALAKITAAAEGATLYVTLEPCCHWGRTPPCTSLIIERKLARVVYGYTDPNPLVNSQGHRLLYEAGVACQHVSLREIDDFYASYQFWVRHKRPYAIAKLATSLDSKIAAAHYQPIQITGQAAQLYTHQQRQKADALLTTARTIKADNPKLTVRLPDQPEQGKSIYILDRTVSIDPDASLFDAATAVTLFYAEQYRSQKIAQLRKNGVKCIAVAESGAGLDLNQVLTLIGQDGIHELWIEAGGRCFSSWLNAGLLQKACIYIAPKILGNTAISAFDTAIDFSVRAHTINWLLFDQDVAAEITFQ